ncbi:NlpC/P60 family protein [Carboxylicivirga caseinilyticus]|uniref:C40 family peptidase n=1 Tax=Carboxylicivirga caseinilyticus TaxID=3417572 RepID=UPI003D32DDF4|nr:C40 family peptidase [Marinilabiliaceae bacterium A049]
MKRFYYILQLVLLVVFGSCNNAMHEVAMELEQVKQKYVPDTRVAVFDVEVLFRNGDLIIKGETTSNDAKADLLNHLNKIHKTVIDSLVVLPVSNEFGCYALVTISVANLREFPRHSSQLVSQIILGTPVKVLKTDGDWSLVQCPDKYIGWTNNSSLTNLSDEEFQNWKGSKRVIILNDAWLRDEQGMVVCDMVKGSIVELIEKDNSECKLALPDGRQGKVSEDSILDFETWLNKIDLNPKALVEDAKNLLGLPYLWGGTSSKALDCSGFVKTIYFLNGYVLMRDASQQIHYGEGIDLDLDKLKQGDLLFFGNKEANKVTHVGMYIGNHEFIHASGFVMINSLDSTRVNFSKDRLLSWLGAQRYVGQEESEGMVSVASHPWYVLLK